MAAKRTYITFTSIQSMPILPIAAEEREDTGWCNSFIERCDLKYVGSHILFDLLNCPPFCTGAVFIAQMQRTISRTEICNFIYNDNY